MEKYSASMGLKIGDKKRFRRTMALDRLHQSDPLDINTNALRCISAVKTIDIVSILKSSFKKASPLLLFLPLHLTNTGPA